MRKLKLITLIIATLGFAKVSFSQNYNINFKIVPSFSLTNTTPLDFGGVVASATAGTVVFNPTNSVRTATGGVTMPAGLSGSPSIAEFSVLGRKNKYYNISFPQGQVTITKAGGGATMTVDSFTLNVSSQRRLSNQGTDMFKVGATLNVGASQTPGVYTGTYTVTVTYQ